jgi:hypothetical protein
MAQLISYYWELAEPASIYRSCHALAVWNLQPCLHAINPPLLPLLYALTGLLMRTKSLHPVLMHTKSNLIVGMVACKQHKQT